MGDTQNNGDYWDQYTFYKGSAKEGENAVKSGEQIRARYVTPARELADIYWKANGKPTDSGHDFYTKKVAKDPRFNG